PRCPPPGRCGPTGDAPEERRTHPRQGELVTEPGNGPPTVEDLLPCPRTGLSDPEQGKGAHPLLRVRRIVQGFSFPWSRRWESNLVRAHSKVRSGPCVQYPASPSVGACAHHNTRQVVCPRRSTPGPKSISRSPIVP